MTIAPGRLAVFFPTLLQQLDFGFWCDAEPSKSKDSCAHRNARCALDHRTCTARPRHRCRGRCDVAQVASVLKYAVQPIAECDQVVPGHLSSPSRTQRLDPFPGTTSAVDHQLASDALTLAITESSAARHFCAWAGAP